MVPNFFILSLVVLSTAIGCFTCYRANLKFFILSLNKYSNTNKSNWQKPPQTFSLFPRLGVDIFGHFGIFLTFVDFFKTFFNNILTFMGTFGHVWTCLDMFGHFLTFLHFWIFFDFFWTFSNFFGHFWTVNYNFGPWKYLKKCQKC